MAARLAAKLNPLVWPLAIRVPAVAVLLMVGVSVVMTDRVLSRLVDTQNRHLAELSGAYLDGLSSALMPNVLREDVWEAYDALERAGQRYKGLDIAWTTVTDADGLVLASSRPRAFPLQNRLPQHVLGRFAEGREVTVDEAAGISMLRRDLVYQDRIIGTVYGEVRIGALIAERWSVLSTLVLTNAALTLGLAALGYAAVRRMLRPVAILAEHMRAGAQGSVEPIPETRLGRPDSEFGRLFRRYNTLVERVAERERLLKHLAEEERLAALGRLASGMAHEINNPLGGMLNALDALKRHGARASVRVTSIRLLERGLTGIRDVVRSTLATYRHGADARPLRAQELDDLALLIQPEIRRKSLALDWTNTLSGELALPASAVRDAVLNLLLNACAASPAGGNIRFASGRTGDRIEIAVSDEGPGLPDNVRRYLESRQAEDLPMHDHAGLGLWVVKRLVHQMGGAIEAEPVLPAGTRVRLSLPERRPDGEMRTELQHVA